MHFNIKSCRGILFLLALSIVTCRAANRESKSVTGINAMSRTQLKPEDLAILLPIRTWQQNIDTLSRDFIPLSKVMGPVVYKRLLESIVDFPGDGPQSPNEFNPSRGTRLSVIRSGLPLEEWFITGIRFIPCQKTRWPVPDAWIEAVNLDLSLCLPLIRLSAQRFARVKGAPNGDLLTTDDKALHLSFVYIGNSNRELLYSKFISFDRQIAEQLVSTLPADRERPLFDLNVLQNIVAERLVAEDINKEMWNGTVQDVQRSFLKLIAENKGDALTGNLRIRQYEELADRQARVLDMIPTVMNTQTLPLNVTFNFAHTGLAPGFSKVWSLGSFSIQAPKLNSLMQDNPEILQPQRLVAASQLSLTKNSNGEKFSIFRLLDRGFQETFVDNFGSISAIDPELRDAIDSARIVGGQAVASIVSDLLSMTGNVIYGAAGDAETSSKLSDQTNGVEVIKREAEISYQTLVDPKLDVSNSSCLSCHIAPSLRLSFNFEPKVSVVSDPANFNQSLKGPAGTGQNEFTKQWLVRSLGYQGRIPSISDRVVAEVNRDLNLLKSFEHERL
ncbi:MAG: hypothetical protein NTX25_18020 [Proteobacteria bacterium]|nr:hypothetical protein [Pseudomonadota bacterium]